MKKFIKDWWPLLLIAGWWLWRRFWKGLPVQTKPTQVDSPEICPKCGSRIQFYEGGNLISKCSNPDCSYHEEVSRDGEPAGVCTKCGAMKYYRYQGSPVDGCSKVNFAVCSNPDCPTHMLLY